MSPSLEDALVLAAEKHRGQTDRYGAPYILHVVRVMLHLGFDATTEERIAAMLHDVVEKTDVTLADLRRRGYPESVVRAVDTLTIWPEEEADYFAAVRRAGADPIGRKVKIADLADNSDLRRRPPGAPPDEERFDKYRKALNMLAADSTGA